MTEDLYSIVSNASKSVEIETKAFYGSELASRGVMIPADPPVPASADINKGPDKMPAVVQNWVNNVGGGTNGDVVMAQPATLAQAGI